MTHIPKLFCTCGAEMKTEDMGKTVEVFIRAGDDGERPYYKVQADLIKCVSCGKEVLLNAHNPLAMTFYPDYNKFPPDYKARL